MSPLWLLVAFPAWTLGVLGYYFLFEAKHDASGDGGLAMMFLAFIWIALPYIWITNLLERKS